MTDLPPIPNLRKQSLLGAENFIPQTHNFIPLPQIVENVKPQKRNFNLKVGDIIYFKSYLSDDFKGVISGDGIASNKLECIQVLGKNKLQDVQSQKSLQCKVGSLSFQKSLFQIITAKKYLYQNQYKEEKEKPIDTIREIAADETYQMELDKLTSDYDKRLVEFQKKCDEEINENERLYTHLYGSNIVYGQEIQLLHIYSGCTLSLNSDILAKENCCRELSLEELPNLNSNFRILSMNSVKNPGEPILYGDQIIVQNSGQSQWNLGIQKPSAKFEKKDGLEVNASEQAFPLKISSYIDNKTEEEINKQQIKGKYLQSGDVVTIKNRYLGGYLCIKRIQRITDGLDKKPLIIKDYETNINYAINQYYFDVDKIRNEKINQMYQLYVDTSPKADEDLNSLWQVQHVDSLIYSRPTYESVFLIRHVCTGLFLHITNQGVGLTYDGLKMECHINLKSKKTSNDPISYSEACKIQSAMNFQVDNYVAQESVVVVCLDETKVAVQRKSQKQNIERATFLFKQTSQDLSKISFRLNSLQEYLIKFYIFLQDWGIVKSIEQNQEEKRKYEYYEAFNNQKSLFDEILQLFQTLDNLKMYLTNEGKPQSNEQLQLKQKALRDNDIINILFAIQRLCNCMIYGNLRDNNKTIQDKSPSKIAKMKLDPIVTQTQKINCIQEIYSLLSLCVQSNPETSNYVLSLEMNKESILDFLLQQLKHQREHVSNLIKESVRYTDMSDTKASIKKWVNELQPLTEDNIEDQALYIEILSLMMIDPYENPNSLCQDSCRRLLFGTKRKPDSSLPFQKALIALDIYEENQSYYPVVQFSPKREKGMLLQLSHQFGQNNPTFCQLYLRFVEKQIKVAQRFITRRPPLVDVTIDFFTTEALKENQLVKQEDLKAVMPIFLKYENYLMNIMDLYSSLCKGRNQKSIKCLMKHCFLNERFLEICLKRQQNIKTELRFERTLIELFCNLYLDIDPLIKVSQFDNKCYLNDDLDQFDIQNQSGVYFYENNASKQLKRNEEYQKFLNQKEAKAEHQYLKLYASKMLSRKQINDVRIYYLEIFTQIDYPDHFKVQEFSSTLIQPLKSTINNINIDYKRLANYQLQYFLGILQIVKNSIDLGYNQLDENQRIFSILPNIFVALILQQRPDNKIHKFKENENFESNLYKLSQSIEKNVWVTTYLPTAQQLQEQRKSKHKKQDKSTKQSEQMIRSDIQFQRNWILQFLIWTFQYCTDDLLKMKIYLEGLQILKIFGFLKLNLQILEFLFSQQQFNESNLSSPSSRDLDQFEFNNHEIEDNIQEEQIKKQKTPSQKAIFNVFKEPDGNRFSALLFSCLLSSEKRNKLNEELLQILINNFHAPKNSTNEIKEVEIIDNLMELKYFSIINGNSDSVQILSPKEAQILTKRAIKYIQNSKRRKNTQKRVTSFDSLKNYQSKVIEQFEQFFKPNSQDAQYLKSFQNIVRNAGVHLVFLQFLVKPQNICSTPDIVQFYKKLILFFEYFTKDNETNIAILAQNEYLYKLLDIIQIDQQDAEDWYYVPIKITKLVVQLLSTIPVSEHDNFIINVFDRIEKLGAELMQSQEFFVNAFSLRDLYFERKVTPRKKHLDAVAYFSLIQYLRILRSLTKTFETPAEQSPLNKHLILSSILQNDFLRIVLEPVNYYKRLLVPGQEQEQQNGTDSLYYHRIKLHAQLIILITDCCQYYRLGIQEMQRIILYEQLKSILLNSNSEYIVKRAYLQCLFELYINKAKEGEFMNDTVESDEVRDILSRIIIPELDQKQICKFLEGLAKLINLDKNKKVTQKDLREQIAKQKRNYFEKRLSIDSTSDKEVGILRDCSEFWTYLRKNGIIHFLVYTYDEMKDRIDIENPENSNLSDEFAIIKQNVQKIKEIFNVLERDFRVKKEDLDLDDYRELIISIEEIIPQRKITKFGQNFRIGFIQDKNTDKLLFDKYDTLKEDQNGEKKLQEQDNVQRIENPFKRNFKIYLIRYKVNILQFCYYIEKNSSELTDQEKSRKIVKTCNVYKQYILLKDIENIYQTDVARIKNQESVNNRNKQFVDWELFKQAMRELFERKFNANIAQQQIQAYQRQQDSLDSLKKDFQLSTIRLIAKYYKKLGGQLELNGNLISEDVQIELLIKTLEKQQTNVFNLDNLKDFLKKCQEIFLNKEIYLIKLCRIFLQLKRPTQDEMDSLTEAKDEDSKQFVREKKETYVKFQRAMADGQLDILALEMLNQTDDDQQKIEALSFLIHLLDYGNEYVQKKFYKLLKEEQVKQKFLVFLRGFFLIDLDVRIKELELTDGDNTEYKLLCLKVLQLLQALCENVNMEFQRFLVFQYDDDSYQANINIVNEVAGLLADLLEKGQRVFYKLQEIYRQALESLVEFSTGYVENKKELCKNARLFTLLNSILQKQDLQNFNSLYKENRMILKEKQQMNQTLDEDIVLDGEGIATNEGKKKFSSYQTLQSFIKLLLLLTQGRSDIQSLEFILKTVDITILIRIAKSIYEERIKPKQRNIVLDNICDESETGNHRHCTNSLCHFGLRTDEDNMLIQTGFNIFIICLKLSEHFPQDSQLELFKFDEEQEEQEDLLDLDDFQEEELQKKKTLSNQKILPINPGSKYDYNQDEGDGLLPRGESKLENSSLKKIFLDVQNDKSYQFDRTQRFFKFYRQFTGRIEIQNEFNQIEKVFFQKPFVCNFITPNIKQHLIYEINRETDEDRMLGLIEFSEFYQVQMRHSQYINNRKVMHFGAVYWRLLKDVSFLLCLIIVVLLIFMHDTVINSKIGSNTEAPEDQNITSGESFVSYLNNIITIVQLVLNLIIVFFCAIERYPISITYNRGQTNAKRVQILKKEAGFQISWLTMKYYSIIGYFESEFQEDKVNQSSIKKFILVIFFDFDNFYNICIFGLTVYAFFNPYIYAILLLDIVKRSEDLQNIIRSITSNGRNLAIFSFLGLIGLLIYAIIAFSNFESMFDDESGVYGQTFILAVTSTINFGLRNGGGIGESLTKYPDAYDDPTLYWGRYFFDFTFFIIFNILFIQIIFGIILDTFGELRDERQALVKEIEGKCFICSQDKNDIDTKGTKGWHYHIYLEHSVYHMLYYIIYIKNKDPNDCNALEKYVNKCIQEKETKFFPFGRALQIESQEEDQDQTEKQ